MSKKILNINFKLINFIIFILNMFYVNLNYITIPFKIISNNEPEKFSSINEYFTYWEYLSFYGNVSIGTPVQKIIGKISFDDYGISILNKGCFLNSFDLLGINYSLNLSNFSSTFEKVEEIDYQNNSTTFWYKDFYGAYFAKDNFYFEDNNKSLKMTNLKFIYSPKDNRKNCTCINLGFKLYSQVLKESNINFVKQLKNMKIISTYDWSILFDKNNKDEGILLIGAKPHEYNPSIYREKEFISSSSYLEDLISYFNFRIDQIYFLSPNNTNEKILITDLHQIYLIPTNGLIRGSQEYEKKIEEYFFSYFISEKKCFKEYKNENDKNSMRTFTCLNSQNIKNELKIKFPALKFLQRSFLFTFELNYDDLFKEKGDKIYFLIWFSTSLKTNWEMGLPFLKKYCFNYNYDSKLVYFYNGNFRENDNQKENNINTLYIIIIISLIIISTVTGFIIGIKIKTNKNKKAHELNESPFIPSLFDKDEKD